VPRLPFVVWLATGVAAAALTLLVAGLPATAFFSGDPGVKLIAARNAIAHPRRPFDVDLPTIGGRPVARVDPMMVPHGDHAHVLQSAVFPVVSAPLIALLGLRGAYLLPAVSFVLMVPLLEAIRRVATPSTPPHIVAGLAVVANPLFFYALEFWEHAPAVALLVGVTALMVRLKAHPMNEAMDLVRGFLAGGLAGIAVLFRPEAALYVAMLLLAFRSALRDVIALAAGATVVVAPLSIASYLHSGSFLGTHLTNTLAPLSREWFSGRVARISAWLWPNSISESLALLALAAAWVARPFGASLRIRQVIGLVGAAWLAILASERALDRNSLWQAFPIAALALVPIASTPALRRLGLCALLTGGLIILTATHDGGAQWGPRFLLVIVPPLILLAAASLADVSRAGDLRWMRVALTVAILLGALLTSRAAYREIRGAKHSYARIVDATTRLTKPGEPIVTNVWWFDQITAALYGTRPFFYTGDLSAANETLRDLSAADQQHLSIVWSKDPGSEPLDSAAEGTCYRFVNVTSTPDRQLVFASAGCAP
jgi:hypothetical protein